MSRKAASHHLKAPPCAGLFVGGGVQTRMANPDRKEAKAASLSARPCDYAPHH